MSSTSVSISSSISSSSTSASAAAAAAAAAATAPMGALPVSNIPTSAFIENAKTVNACGFKPLNNASPMRSAVKAAVAQYLASKAAPSTVDVTVNCVRATSIAQLLQLKPLPNPQPPNTHPLAGDLSWRPEGAPSSYYHYDEAEEDAEMTEYCRALTKARCQLTSKISGELEALRQERRTTLEKLRKLQRLRNLRSSGKSKTKNISKSTLAKLKSQQKLVNNLALLQLSSSSVSSTDEAQKCPQQVKHVHQRLMHDWMVHSSSPVGEDDCDLDDVTVTPVTTSTGFTNGNGNGSGKGNGKNNIICASKNRIGNGVIQRDVGIVVDNSPTASARI